MGRCKRVSVWVCMVGGGCECGCGCGYVGGCLSVNECVGVYVIG